MNWRLRVIISYVVLALVPICPGSLASAVEKPKRVLILHSGESKLPAPQIIDQSIRSILRSTRNMRVECYSEYLDFWSFPNHPDQQQLAQLLHQKYGDLHLDLIIPVGAPAFYFLKDRQDKVFQGAPYVYCGLEKHFMKEGKLPAGVPGVPLRIDVSGTMDLMSKIHPKMRQVFVITGVSELDRALEAATREQLDVYDNRIKINYLNGLSMDELLDRLGRLPEDAAVLLVLLYRDATGELHSGSEIASLLCRASMAPVYGVSNTYMGQGILGGSIIDFEALGNRVGEMAMRVLKGESQNAVAATDEGTVIKVVDWRELKRWGISESSLPEGASVWYKETTIWDEYRWEIIGIGAFILLQSLVTFVLMVNRTKRRKAELLLHQKEESLAESQRENGARLRLMADSLPVLISYVDKEERFRFNNLAYEKWYDISREELYEKEVRQVVGEEKYTLLQPYIKKVLGGEAVRFEILAPALKNQPAQHLKATYVPHHDENGCVLGFYTLVEDVTEARRVEMEIRRQLSDLAYASRINLMGELTASLAHELNQPLAAILSNAQAARRIISREDPDIAEITEILEDIIADDRRAGEVIRRLRTLLKRGEMEMTDVNLSELVEDAVRLVKPDLTLKDVTMELMLDEYLPPVRADSIQLQQVIINLIVNACTAMQKTNPELRKVIIKTERHDPDTVMVSVKDFGTGFDAGVAGMLFKPFFTTRSDGMGMGLAVCRHIIEKHGGRIWAVNGPNHGATFSFSLPSGNSGEETGQGIVPTTRTVS